MTDPLTLRLAATVHTARTSQGLSAAVLAENSGVSRAMIGKIERGDVQPTAALLAKLSAALGMTLTELIARAEGDGRRLVRAAEQPVWVDPDSGYRRRSVSPAAGRPLELVEIELPAGAEVPLRASTFLHQQIWVLAGRLRLSEGAEVHELDAGDCLQLGSAPDRVFANPGSLPCRYLVALVPRAT
ncbi:helix-turn-helix domain-containing protein [Amycolatopsis sp. NBC_00438]|uniref:helix-turn-helix domain-containing protein n=1 Tax=Amycolatopsis sp. NBC_00438 TaxID=2903558 RepID=UPI002E24580C